MRIDSYLKHIPVIEGWLREHKPDALVCGLGPTAWLLPWIDQSLLSGVRLWGCHNACQIMNFDDIVVMDSPVMELHPNTYRHGEIVKSRPKRLWIYRNNAPTWDPFLHPAVKSITQLVDFAVLRPNQVPADLRKVKFKLEANPPHTTTVSPTGMTTLAWREGARRIGVLGVDLERNQHHAARWSVLIDHFMASVAEQAQGLGGSIINLSPVTSLVRFAKLSAEWLQKAPSSGSSMPSSEPSRSEPTSGSTQTVPSPTAAGRGLDALSQATTEP